jgi:hypothetical protein
MDTFFARSLYPFAAQDDDELSFPAGAVIRVVRSNDDEWWSGVYDGRLRRKL